MLTLINGQRDAAWPVFDRGLQFGDGLFETMLCRDGAAVHFEQHWQRLQLGCRRLGIRCPDIAAPVRAAIAEQGAARAIAKLIVTRGSSRRGYQAPQPECPNWTLTVAEAPPAADYAGGVALHLCATRLPADPLLAGVKHLNRLHQVLARREWDQEYHDGLLCSHDGAVIEGCAHNLFIVERGRLATPDLSQAGVDGIMRQQVLAWCRAHGLATAVERLLPSRVLAADEVFITNSLNGVVPVRAIGGTTFQPGPVTAAIAAGMDAHMPLPQH